jgi:GNAT superfamily N-acetyltransferase
MVHALVVAAEHRRQGVAGAMMIRAARWARAQGCRTLALAVVASNAPARALFGGLGLNPVADYHYRVAGVGGSLA